MNHAPTEAAGLAASLSLHSPAKIASIIDYERGGQEKNHYGAADVEAVPCPLCGAERFEQLYVERGSIGVVQCRECELIYASPRMKNPEHVYWGQADHYAREARLIFEGKAVHHRDQNYRDDLELLRRFRPAGKLLDVGTSMGFFLRHASTGGWDVTGLDPSPSLSALAREKFGLNVVNGFLQDARFPDESFDIITMTDVFEHVAEPRLLLREAWRVLRPGGVVLVKVPNGLFNLAKLRVLQALGQADRFDIFDAHEHVVHYSEKTLRRMLEQGGFVPLHCGTTRPIQVPVWHQYVGAYYLYEVPFLLDWKRQLGRSALYQLARLEYRLRGKHVGWLAPNIITVAEKTLRS